MNGPMTGTSLEELQKREPIGQYGMQQLREPVGQFADMQQMQQMQYGAMQNLQYEQGHNAPQTIQQAQHAPYYESNLSANGTTRPIRLPEEQQQLPLPPREVNRPDIANMQDLAKDITNNLPPDDTFVSSNEMIEEPIKHMNSSSNNTSGGLLSPLPEITREPLILIVLYVILSLSPVRNGIGKYIPQINPDAECKVSLTGIIIYSIILAILFALAKKYLLKQ